MPSGGARATAGRKPEPNALRRERDGKEWTKLPASGRGDKPTPEWPEDGMGPATPQELRFWTRIWRSPQALVWEADAAQDQVATYVRTFIQAADFEASASLRTLARQLAEALLLTTPALHAARYVIDASLDGAAPAVEPATGNVNMGRQVGAASAASAAAGFRVLPGGLADEDD